MAFERLPERYVKDARGDLIPDRVQRNFEHLERRGSGRPAFVSALPANPRDGAEVYFQSTEMAALGVLWHLRYRSGASGSYKWEVISGNGMYDFTPAGEFTASTTYTALTTAGPIVKVPLAGDYLIDVQATMRSPSTAATSFMSYDIGGTGANDADALTLRQPDASNYNVRAQTIFTKPKTFATAGVNLTAKYRVDGGSAALFWQRWIRITPVRVG